MSSSNMHHQVTSAFFLLGAAFLAGGIEAGRNDCQNLPWMSEFRSTCGSVVTEE